MSYIRYTSPYKYLYGKSNDYVFESSEGIEDYGGMSNESIIEILLSFSKNDDDLILAHLAKRLAENLGIELRETPLTIEQLIDESFNLQRDGK